MIILAIETSTMTGSVALVRGELGSQLEVLAVVDDAVSTHSDILLPGIQRVLAGAGVATSEIDAVAVGAGPGSFTGLRIGMATAKGLAFAIGAPLWAVSSLAVLAQDAALLAGDRLILPVIDARRDEVFAGFFRRAAASGNATDGVVSSLGDELVIAPDRLAAIVRNLDPGAQISLVGDGAIAYADELSELGKVLEGARSTPSALSVARLVLASPQTDVLASGAPTYIRKSEAEIRFPEGNPGGTFAKKVP